MNDTVNFGSRFAPEGAKEISPGRACEPGVWIEISNEPWKGERIFLPPFQGSLEVCGQPRARKLARG